MAKICSSLCRRANLCRLACMHGDRSGRVGQKTKRIILMEMKRLQYDCTKEEEGKGLEAVRAGHPAKC